MNNDLISREALLKAMEEERQFLLARGQTGAEHILVHHCLPIIGNAPTVHTKPFANVTFDKDELEQIVRDRVIKPIKNGELVVKEERPRGEWIDHSEDEGYLECPICGCLTNCDGNKEELHYCWNCGADMRKETDND